MFCKTVGEKNSPLMLIGEAPGEQEDREGVPFVGSAGKTLNFLLQQSGISRSECVLTNVARLRPVNNEIHRYYQDKNNTIPTPQMQEWIDLLKQEIIEYSPNIIVALGSTALYTLTGEKGITSFRGYIQKSTLVPGVKVISTFHPAAVLRDHKLHFTSILDLRKALRNSESKEIKPDPRRLHATITFNEFMEYVAEMSKFDITAPPIAIDIETAQPNSHIHILGIADSPVRAYSFEILKDHKPTLTSGDEFLLWKAIDELFQRRRLLMHNGSYDATVLMQNNGIYCKNFVIDTLVAAHICWPECPRSLGFLSSICLDVPAWKHTSSLMPTLYNAADAANTFGIWEVMEKELQKKNLMNVFNFEMSQLEPAMMLQLQGLKVNEDVRTAIKEKSNLRIAELEKELEVLVGKKVNYNSPKQLQQLLYFDLELPIQYKRRKVATEDRKMSADAESVKKLWLKTHNSILEKIMELKKLIKLVTSFIDIEVSPEGRVHTCYNVTGATMARETKGYTLDDEGSYKSFGRWSSSKSIILPYGSGNLQNNPKKARKMFTAPEGKVFLQADYMQAEAVVVAYLISDGKLKRLFQESFGKDRNYRKENDLDVHKLTGAMMFKKSIKDVTPEERTIGKTIRHACVDSETEVLTETGWKKIPEFNRHYDKVAQWDTDGTITFVSPTETVCYPYEGELLHFYAKNIDQLVSPGHRMPVYNRKTNETKVIFSEHAFRSKNGDLNLPLSGRITDNDRLQITPDYMRLFVAFQADGSIRERGNKKELNFYLKKERKQTRLRSLLDANEISYSESKASGDRILFYISYHKNKDLFDFIKYANKRFGVWVLWLSPECIAAAVDEARWWDSSRSDDNNFAYYSKYKENCEWMATMAHLSNYRAIVSDKHPTVFTTHISKYNNFGLSHTNGELIPYSGYIYSMQVPSSFYMIRRNGKISVTGNTNYSAGPAVLSARLDISMKDAKLLLSTYHNACPQLQVWQQRIQEELKRTRTLTNLFGRRHYFLERWGDNLFRSAYSFMPQSTVGDLLNKALVTIYNNHPELDIILQLHDAIYCFVDEDKVEQSITTMRNAMLIPLQYKGEEFTIDVDFSVGKSWGELEEL